MLAVTERWWSHQSASSHHQSSATENYRDAKDKGNNNRLKIEKQNWEVQ